ncbi:uncharacterized protein LOC128557820 [Mercenaria mercenaria]|uniref:uncharacterized protein LOC128557820 n=1 Tax=Mercenaria mercenaria TaxID=6596 RepID=UPI00234ED3C8|nr:uncharacterized protein LOC128557820 [Mercenaria mercenaria]
MNETLVDLYKRALAEGSEKVHNIRVMIVGHFGVGKTTLTKRLFEEDVVLNNQESTEGIEVHVRKCKVSLEDGSWHVLDEDDRKTDIYKRLAKLFKANSAGRTTETDNTRDVSQERSSASKHDTDTFEDRMKNTLQDSQNIGLYPKEEQTFRATKPEACPTNLSQFQTSDDVFKDLKVLYPYIVY